MNLEERKLKKRIISLLLCLCMAFSLLPVSALATTEVEVTLGCTSLGKIERTLEMSTGISSYTDTTQQQTPESVTLSVGQQGSFQRLPTATFNNVQYSPKSYGVIWGRCVDVSDPKVVGNFQYSLEYYTDTDYPCLQFNYTAKQTGTATIKLEFFYNFGFDPSEVQNGNTWWRQTKTINVTVTDSATEPEMPEKPTVSDIQRFRDYVNDTSSSKGAVYMWCAASLYDHGAWFSYLTDVEGGYSLGEVVANTESNAASYPWVCPMTVYGDKYLAAYNSEPGFTQHWLEDGKPVSQTVNWYYSAQDSRWKFKSGAAPISFDITHDNPYPAPTTADFANQAILVKCDTDDSHNAQLLYSDGTYTISWAGDDRCTLTFDVDSYVAAYGQTHEGHTAVEGQTVTKGFSYSNGEWRADDTPGPEIHVVCESTQPPTPDKPTAPSKEDLSKLEKPVEVVCTTNPTAHIAATFVLIEGTYNIGDVTGDETDGYTCDITVTADEYVTKYNTDFGAHTLSGDNTKTLTLKYVDGKWVANGTVTFNVECTEAEKHPVMLVIYRNGDTEKAYKTVALEKMPKGTVIDLTKLNIADYYTANYTGKYDFYGWYDDGLWNIYKQDLTKQLDGLTTKTVNGWTNLKCMVYDYEKVVYYMSDADRVADNRLFETTARKGAALPTADAPTATRDGYTFKFWSREGQSSNVTGQTVNGWTNLVANWKVTPHNIYAYARLNSYFAPLTTKEFDTPVTLNAATLSRLGLGSYNSLGYISIGSFDFDAVPLAGDQYFGDDAELDAVVTELAESIALENGVSEDTAEKIAWTVLYKTVNEEDMAPGYPAEDGYQLSGNLDLATVMFKAGGDNVEDMPAVNYTYDNIIEIHDFYFAGDTFTLPADPTREGYSFEGWSVEVIPAENDADHLDADGSDDAADETLFKAGDTYTITGGGVIFTAQWQKKTFTVKYYLLDETGAWVEKKMDTVDSVDYATYSLWTPNAEDGYEFSGWYQKTAEIGVKGKVEQLYMAKEWKLYGKFTPIEYNIQYVYNDGKATSTNPTTYTVESDTITLADATGADWGKTFLEWHDENDQKITAIPTGSTGDRVITAYWNWPVYLHYLDKNNNEIDTASTVVSELDPSACILPTGEKTGYDFDGWYEAKKDIGTASQKLNALSIAKKWELYGRYTAKTDVSYTVKYLREGDNKVLAPEKVVTDQTFDTEVTEQAADVVGYTPDAPSKTMILDEYNKVLTFSYSANTYRYEIHYFLQEPDGSYMEKEVDTTPTGVFDTTVTITPDPNRYGAHYSYNSVKSVVSGVVTVDDPATILKLNVYYDLDFHTLTFDTMGGSTIAPVKVRHGLTVAKPTDPTKDKYTFIGWYVDPEFSAEYDFATVLEADKTIYAKFELTATPIGDIYVRYDVLHIKQLPDGSYDEANAEIEHLQAKKDSTVTAVVKDYSASHHVTVNTDKSFLKATAIQPHAGADGKPVYTILKVYYDLDYHTLTFDTMGGSRIDPVTVRHGNAVAKPKDPVNGGYIFDGWYTDKTYRTPYNFAAPLTEDITIYSKWVWIVLPGTTVKKNTPKLNTAGHFAYVQGYPDGTVKPTGNITRAETAAILFRLMDDTSRNNYYSTKSGFRDVAAGSWYNTYVATLNNAGVITDSSNGYFRPNEAITRAELAAMLAQFADTKSAPNYFTDVTANYWAANAIAVCAKLGWINGYPDGTFRPDQTVTRAEMMAMINRALERTPKSAADLLAGMKVWNDNANVNAWYYLDVQEATNSHTYTKSGTHETWKKLR